MTLPQLKSYQRIVVKIGSALLVDRADGPEARVAGKPVRRYRGA